jgi:Flp pilus assembly protein TadD
MSVLYKALAKAGKARESAQDEAAYTAPNIPVMKPRRKSPWRVLSVAITAVLTLLLSGLYWFSDDLMELAPGLIGGDPAPLTAAPVKRQPVPAVPLPSAVVPVPVPLAKVDPAPSSLPAAEPAAIAPPPEPAVAAPAAAPVPASEPAPAATAEIEDTAPPPPAVTEADVRDLPAVMDRIRRQKQGRTLQPTGAITHSRDPIGVSNADGSAAADGPAGVVVSVEHPPVRDSMNSGYRALLGGQYETALGLYATAAAAEPKSAAAHLGKGTALHKLRRYSEARSEYEQVLLIDSGNPEALTNLMAIIANDSPGRALDELRHLQSISPGFSPVAAQIGGILAQSGDLAGAINQLSSAIALSPENGLYRLNLAVVQDRAGMPAEALASYRRALDTLSDTQSLPIATDQIRDRIRYLEKR